jgi:hypothetical protein
MISAGGGASVVVSAWGHRSLNAKAFVHGDVHRKPGF